jgi:hypothetical protein
VALLYPIGMSAPDGFGHRSGGTLTISPSAHQPGRSRRRNRRSGSTTRPSRRMRRSLPWRYAPTVERAVRSAAAARPSSS